MIGKAIVAVGMVLFGSGTSLAAPPADPETPANVTVEEVKHTLAAATAAHPADLAGKSLRNLDFSKADFSGANLRGANLFGTKLDGANLMGADLTDANLNLSWLIHANFTGANLTGASLVAPVVAEGLIAKPGEIPVFKDANLSGARVQARFTAGDLRGTKFVGADLSAHLKNQSMGLMHTEMGSANLAGADLSKANLGHIDLTFANLRGVDFADADLTRADLSGADARGANFAGADLTGAVLDRTKLDDARGLDSAKGLETAHGYALTPPH